MRIMYYPQISMRSYATGKWLLDSASQLIRMTAMARTLRRKGNYVQWLYVLPYFSQMDTGTFPGWDYDNIETFQLGWPENAAASRCWFDLEGMEAAIVRFDPDVVINEQPEHSVAFKHLQQTYDFKLVSSYVHVPWYEDDWEYPRWDAIRQMSGFCADAVAFQSSMEMAHFLEASGGNLLDMPDNFIWDWLIDMLDHVHSDKIRTAFDVAVSFTYPGRTSDVARTKFDVVITAWERFHNLRQNTELRILDPNQSCGAIEQDGVICDISGSNNKRASYLEKLRKTDVVISLGPTVSIGLAEAAASGCALITRKQTQTSMRIMEHPSIIEVDLSGDHEAQVDMLLDAMFDACSLIENRFHDRDKMSRDAIQLWSADSHMDQFYNSMKLLTGEMS